MDLINLTEQDVRGLLPQRRPDVHKGDLGKVLVVAGSRGMMGAAILSSRSCLRAGAGLVTLATANSQVDITDVRNLEVMTMALLETETGCISRKAFDLLQPQLKKYDTFLIGPGLSPNKSTLGLVQDLLTYLSQEQKSSRVVVDADGLKAIKKLVRPLRIPTIVTPHFGELAYILDRTISELKAKPVFYARKLADRLNIIVVLKSHQTYIVEPGRDRCFINNNGNPGLAKAGSGDVLAGLLTGLWASHKIAPLPAAVAAPYIHGLAANLAVSKQSLDGIIASDILKEIPAALKIIKGL